MKLQRRVLLKFIAVWIMYFTVQMTSAQSFLPLNEDKYRADAEMLLKSASSDSVQALQYFYLADYYRFRDTLKFWENIRQGERKGKAFKSLQAMGALYKSFYYGQFLDSRRAEIEAQKCVDILGNAKEHFQQELLAKAWYNLGLIRFPKKGFADFLDILNGKCMPYAKAHDPLMEGAINTMIGLTFMSSNQLVKADEYHQLAIKQLEQQPKSTALLVAYLNAVSTYCYQVKSKEARLLLDKAKLLLGENPNSSQLPSYFYNEALYFTTKQQTDEALRMLDVGLDWSKKMNNWKFYQMMLFRKFNVYLMQKKYAEAKLPLQQIIKNGLLTRDLYNSKIVYSQLASVNELMGDYKEALKMSNTANKLSDSIQKVQLLEKMNEMEAKYKAVEKEKLILNLRAEKGSSQLKIFLVLSIAILLFIIVLFVTFSYRKQRKLNGQIQINHEVALEKLAKEKQLQISESMLKGEEQERQRIAQDLHDSIGGMLTGLKFKIAGDHSKKNDLTNELPQKLNDILGEVRRISHNLMPESLRQFGLIAALEQLCLSMRNSKVTIQFENYEKEVLLDFQKGLAIYRIVQEAISNALKYADPDLIIVQVSKSEETLLVLIEDNGKGFDPSVANYGMGLNNMINRIKWIGGSIDIHSKLGSGTQIEIGLSV
ncbi:MULTISPECIES: sensor histidine kinase [unclassified Sphingobacterium]|uniref:sensor histidine kinase n=1 Tax=unclassified Sphingobacterium TaxID=2609468 RepID=UPI0025F52E17|nr:MULTISPECIES: sensor histidine kinase [unclassified Sphingobacterium]